MKNGFTITQRNAVVEQHLWCIDTIMAQYAAFMQTEPVDPDDVYQSLAVRLIRAVNSYDPRKGYREELQAAGHKVLCFQGPFGCLDGICSFPLVQGSS